MKVTKVHIDAQCVSGNVVGGATVEFDEQLMVRDFRVVKLRDGRLSVKLPNRQHSVRCQACNARNCSMSKCCCMCGVALPSHQLQRPYVDTVVPIKQALEAEIVQAVLEAFRNAHNVPSVPRTAVQAVGDVPPVQR